jgi:hypothetical protein
MKDKLLKMNLQFFAEQDGDSDDSGADEQDKGQQDDGGSDEQQEEMIPKSQMEKIIKDRVAREKKAAEKAVEEAKRLAKMNEDEKQQYEFEQLQQELADLKRKDAFNGLSKEASKMLAEQNIQADEDLLAFVVKEDAEATKTAVNSFVSLINKKVEDGVKKALSGTAPKVNTGNTEVDPFTAAMKKYI